ncbi:MAG TPA: ROK family protein [Verrucomicrobiota bacterium]|nr:ROK family protein [Verrucomicrobiota bacterium]
MESVFVGIEIGGTKIQVVTGDANASIIARQRFTADPARGAEGIREQIADAMIKITEHQQITAVGVGFGGPFNRVTGRACCSHQVDGWDDFPLCDWLLEQAAGVPVAIENDGNTAALGEALAGAGQGMNPVFYVTLGSGIGGGLVIDGSIYHGTLPTEAEIGHVRINPVGETLESRCSGWAVDRRLREYAAANPDSPLSKRLDGEGGEARHLAKAMADGDAGAKAIFDGTCSELAFGLSHVVHLINPEAIILGGGLSQIGEPLRLGVAAALGLTIMDVLKPGPSVRLAKLGEDAVPVGALLLALNAG